MNLINFRMPRKYWVVDEIVEPIGIDHDTAYVWYDSFVLSIYHNCVDNGMIMQHILRILA